MLDKVISRNFLASNQLKLVFSVNGMAFCAAVILFCLVSESHAAITGTGDLSPTNPATWPMGINCYIGLSSVGSVTVNDGSGLYNSDSFLGYNSGANGTATITGTGSLWSINHLEIGWGGSGTLKVEAGGQVNGSWGTLGSGSDSTGTAMVTGTGSTWTNTMSLAIGSRGNGTLNIEAGGQVSSPQGYIGVSSGSTGTVTVTGSGSKWTNSSRLFVGYEGNGTLTVANGGAVTAKTIFASLGNLLGDGSITAQGAVLDADLVFDGSHGMQQAIAFGTSGTLNLNLDGSNELGVGYKGAGSLRIADGVAVASSDGYLGYSSGSTSTATITDTGSKWTTSRLYIGSSGSGTLKIEKGGQVSTKIAYIASQAGSTGVATVSGADAIWTSNEIYIGRGGNGTLNIGGTDSGGLVITKSLYIGSGGGSTGTFNLNNGGTLQTGGISLNSGSASFNWNDGTIQNYNSTTDLYIGSSLGLKLAATGTHAFNIDSGRTGTVYAVLSDATSGGTLNKIGPGTLVLQKVNTYSGETTVESGRFKVTGSILNTSGITVGESGILELAKTSGSATAVSLPISNDGTVLISAGSQKVGTITGAGITQVNAGATLTVQSIVQGSLIIGGTGAAQAVPEPSTIALLGMGAFGLLAWAWRRTRKAV